MFFIQGDILEGFFGTRGGNAIGFILMGPNLRNGENSLETMFKYKRESLFKKYNNEVKDYINQNSKLLHERMINKKSPPLIRVKLELE